MEVERLGIGAILVVFVSFALVLCILVSFIWYNWKREARRGDTCPYCRGTMRLGVDVASSLVSYVNVFMQEQEQPDNPDINFAHCAFCPKSGRIFPECVRSQEQISLSWDFIKRRCEGTFVSWGSLSEEERGVVRLLHNTLEGFQVDASSSKLRPEDIVTEYEQLSPGPLYVDKRTKVLLGWKKVPGTYFEVLVVQKPQFQSIEETI